MKAKKPFQLIILDDDGREMYTTYVGEDTNYAGFDLEKTGQAINLIQEIRTAINEGKAKSVEWMVA